MARRAARSALIGLLALSLAGGPALAAESTRYTYDALGRVTSAIDANGRKVVYTYDGAGNRTRLSNGAEFAEILPTAWSASSNAGTTGLTATNGLRDGQFSPLASIHATTTETGAWIKADLGAIKSVNHIELAGAVALPVGAGIDDLNGATLEASTDGVAWRSLAAISGIGVGTTRTIALGGVTLRYLRIKRSSSGQVALGDLRLYSAATGNSPLIAEPDSITTTGAAVTFDPRLNDRDLDGHAFTIATVEDPPHGTAIVNGGGVSITYTPDPGYVGADSFLYAVADGHNGTSSARVAVVVQSSGNHVPVAVADSFTVPDRANGLIDSINALRPLNNDYDADGDVLTITSTTNPSHGTVAVVGGNIINYQPAVGYSSTDSFTYTVSDGRGGSAPATVTLTVANSAPVANPDTASTASNTPVVIDVLTNDSDPNGDTLTVQSISSPANGSTTSSGGLVTYTPANNFSGADSFTYAISDSRGKTATGAASISVSRPYGARLAVMQSSQYGGYVNVSGNTYTVQTTAYGNVYVDNPMSTGKFYWEVKLLCGVIAAGVTNDAGSARWLGGRGTHNAGVYTWNDWAWVQSQTIYNAFTPGSTNDIYGFSLDADANVLKIYKNNALGATINLPFGGPYYAHSGAQPFEGSARTGQACPDGPASGEFKYGVTGTTYAPPTGHAILQGPGPNAAPRAAADLLYAVSGSAKTFDPRANDSDPNGDVMTIAAVGAPALGSATLNAGASITYTAPIGYTGLDSFTYTVADASGATHSTSVTVMVGGGAPSFAVSPAVAGKSVWNIETDGPLNLNTPGVWTLVPQYSVIVPVKAWGGAGGTSCCGAANGGGGGFAGGAVLFASGTSYSLYVGGGGAYSPEAANGGANGGGHAGNSNNTYRGAGGGGYSGVRLTSGGAVLIAGGGGGAGWGGGGGGGGGVVAENGLPFAFPGTTGGLGGSAGAYQGAVGGANGYGGLGGGGGGGYLGGGGGGAATTGQNGGGGGGGGSGYIDPAVVQAPVQASAVGPTPAQSSDVDRGTAGSPQASTGHPPPAGRLILGSSN